MISFIFIFLILVCNIFFTFLTNGEANASLLENISISKLVTDFFPSSTIIHYEDNNNANIIPEFKNSSNEWHLLQEMISNDNIFFQKGILAKGQNERYQNIKMKLELNQTVNIITIGGSITVGHVCGACTYFNLSWPLVIQDILTTYGYNIQVHNFAQQGISSQEFVHLIMEWKFDVNHIIHKADLIFVETCVNDVNELMQRHQNRYGSLHPDAIAQHTEVLIRNLLSLAQNPAILYIEASTRYKMRPSEAVESHRKIILPYGLSQFSVIHTLLPLDTKLKQYWLRDILLADRFGHYNQVGHRLLGVLAIKLLCLFMYDYDSITLEKYPNLQMMSNTSSTINYEYLVENPIFVSRNISILYEQGTPFFLDLTKPNKVVRIDRGVFRDRFVPIPHQFDFYADVKGKMGLIATNISAYVTIRLYPMEINRHLRFGVLKLEYLTSYENMGVMNVTLSRFPFCSKNIQNLSSIYVTNSTLDTLHNHTVSIAQTADILFERQNIVLTDCLDINIVVIDSSEFLSTGPPRNINKIKLLGLHLY